MFIKTYDRDGEFDGYISIKGVDSFIVEYFNEELGQDGYFQLSAQDACGETLFLISKRFFFKGSSVDREIEKAEKLLDKIMKKINASK